MQREGCSLIFPSLLQYLSNYSIHAAMKAYLETVQEKARENKIDLLKAFKVAQIPTSTYYRTINGETEMRFDTACKVLDAIDEQIRRDKAAQYTKQLRASGQDISRSKARQGVKPRKLKR